jgi:sulfatase modifying factor 1
MTSRFRSAAFPIVLVAAALAMVRAAPTRADEPPAVPTGLVAERPADGPAIETDRGFMVPYALTIPGTDVTFEMVPIPGGTFTMGSPEGESGRAATEGPPFRVTVEPFWMGRCEVSWAEYRQYMDMFAVFKEFESKNIRAAATDGVDAITAPSRLYDPTFTFDKGDDPRLPAVSMSQYAARQYTKWLSGLTGQFWRLPGEAEWEYACRAGTDTPWSCGDDPASLDEFAWHAGNAGDMPHPVGEKRSNAWGLHDMHGNALEWVIDEMLPEGYARFAGGPVTAAEALVWPQHLTPRVLRGGSWDSDALDCRSAARLGSNDRAWTETDPNLPKSPWWFTDGPALAVGFRVVRPLHEPPADQRARFWEADDANIRRAVAKRLSEGRGASGVVDQSLPAAIEALK